MNVAIKKLFLVLILSSIAAPLSAAASTRTIYEPLRERFCGVANTYAPPMSIHMETIWSDDVEETPDCSWSQERLDRALIAAVRIGDAARVHQCTDVGANTSLTVSINHPTKSTMSLFFYACTWNRAGMKALLDVDGLDKHITAWRSTIKGEAGTEITPTSIGKRDDSSTVDCVISALLDSACNTPDEARGIGIIDRLAAEGVSIDEPWLVLNKTALMEAAELGRACIVQHLLKNYCKNVNAAMFLSGDTAFTHAIKSGNFSSNTIPIMQMLLNYGANPHVKVGGVYKYTPLEMVNRMKWDSLTRRDLHTLAKVEWEEYQRAIIEFLTSLPEGAAK